MSLTTTSICLSNYHGIPTDVVNLISKYAATEEHGWVPSFDSFGNLKLKVNVDGHSDLSQMWRLKPLIMNGVRDHQLVLNMNQNLRYNATTYVQRVREIENSETADITLYSAVEVVPNKFDYYIITYHWENNRTEFVRGSMYEFTGGDSIPIVSFHMNGNEMFIGLNTHVDEDEIDWTF